MSPVKSFFIVVPYWTTMFSSKPHSSRIASICVSVGCLPAIRTRRVAVREHVEDQEGEDRDREQHEDHRDEAADDEASHSASQCSILTFARGSSASRTPSPKTLSESTVSTSIAPGTIASIGGGHDPVDPVLDHRAPRGLGRADAGAQERERRLEQDRVRDQEREEHDQGRR